MATNRAIDDRLIEDAKRIGRHKTKKEAVTAALEEYVRRREQLVVAQWSELVREGRVQLMGPIRLHRLLAAKR